MSTLRLNLPTLLTLSRIVLIPVFVLLVYQHPILGAIIFGIASITDFLDGYLARRSGQVTKFGIILDPLADKFLVISALIVLVDMERLSAIVAIILIVREFLITALRVVALSKDIVIAAELGGKMKTAAQITAVFCLILTGSIIDRYFPLVDLYDVGLALICCLWSFRSCQEFNTPFLFGKGYDDTFASRTCLCLRLNPDRPAACAVTGHRPPLNRERQHWGNECSEGHGKGFGAADFSG